ncbi:unnamed protein product [Parnassius mnemosyne]|uniref:Endonuclease/exonuclease/phosphatase domain-containing protein n=1 Tax=Parnassius mnemosyne TaxID=213953 RepID=A0AAV1K8P2_9NEOP
MKVNTKPCHLNLVVVYAPTAGSTEVEIQDFYRLLEDNLRSLPRREVTLLMGDLNAKVGSTRHEDHLREVVGKYGLGERNNRGEMWLQFCAENSLTIMNTCFQNHPRRLYTWVMPGDRARNQIDYIAIAKRWRSSIINTKTYPGADCGSDHKLLVAVTSVKLKKCLRSSVIHHGRPSPETLSTFKEVFSKKVTYVKLNNSIDIDTKWTTIKNIILDTRKETQQQNYCSPRKAWISEETWKVINERKNLYNTMSAKVKRLCRRDYNQYLNLICEDVEDHAKTMHTKDLFLRLKASQESLYPKAGRSKMARVHY